MNKRYKELFSHVIALPIVAALVEHEIAKCSSLADLVFSVEYTPYEPGCGRVSVYRLSSHTNQAAVHPERSLMDGRIWFMESSNWRCEPNSLAHERFFALASILHEYRPIVRVDVDKPMLSFIAQNLPATMGFSQVRPSPYHQLELVG